MQHLNAPSSLPHHKSLFARNGPDAFISCIECSKNISITTIVKLFVDAHLCYQLLFLWEALLVSIHYVQTQYFSLTALVPPSASIFPTHLNHFSTNLSPSRSINNQPIPSQSLQRIWLDRFLSLSLVLASELSVVIHCNVSCSYLKVELRTRSAHSNFDTTVYYLSEPSNCTVSACYCHI